MSQGEKGVWSVKLPGIGEQSTKTQVVAHAARDVETVPLVAVDHEFGDGQGYAARTSFNTVVAASLS